MLIGATRNMGSVSPLYSSELGYFMRCMGVRVYMLLYMLCIFALYICLCGESLVCACAVCVCCLFVLCTLFVCVCVYVVG